MNEEKRVRILGTGNKNVDFGPKSMVEEQIRARGIRDQRVLAAMRAVPRHRFVPYHYQDIAYSDGPLPIGAGQTISQPYVVAAMTEALDANTGDRILEVGTGSGYQTAILCEMALEVFTLEYVEELSKRAQATLSALHYDNLHFRMGDGHRGWPEEAPFDGIIATAAPANLPEVLCDQLKPGGKLVIPIGVLSQDLRVYQKEKDGSLTSRSLFPVRFVPMVQG